MIPAATYPRHRDRVRLLVIDPQRRRIDEGSGQDLPALLSPGDLLVVNDAATLPASLSGHDQQGAAVEARLAAATGASRFWAVLFGDGDWRARTEDRPPPPRLEPGARLVFGSLSATVLRVSAISPRLIELAFDGAGDDTLITALYAHGRPVQYSYLSHPLPLWAVQTVYGARPWSFEMPSAGRPLSWDVLLTLRSRGVRWASVTHAAGLSSTGDPRIDAALPLAERYDVPAQTAAAVNETRRAGARVVAVGTTVVRALESAAAPDGLVRAGQGETELRILPGFSPRVVDGILSGVHGPGESHFSVLGAFADERLLRAAWQRADAAGFRSHELGDATLVLPARRARPRQTA